MIAHKKKKNGFTNCLSGIWLPLYSVQIFASLILRSAASIVTDETNRTNIKVWNWKYVMKRALNSHSSTDCIPASSCKTSNTLQAWLLGGTQVRNGVYFVSLTFSTHVLHAHAEAVPKCVPQHISSRTKHISMMARPQYHSEAHRKALLSAAIMDWNCVCRPNC